MSLTPSEIVKHIKTYLPMFTDRFSQILSVSAASVGAGNILTITATAHGKSAGQYIVITAGVVRNALVSSSLIDPTVNFETGYDHDLTRPSLPNDDYYLTLGGFASVWDGQHEIIDVANRRNFEVNLPTGETLAPAVDGSQYLLEPLPKGVYQIDTVPDADTITVDLSSARSLPVGVVDDINVVGGFRISAAADYNRARNVYSAQATGDAYLFVIMTDTDVSKDRNNLNDSIAELSHNDINFLRLLQSFSTTVFLPTTEDTSGVDAQELAYDEIFAALLKTLFGYSITGSMFKSISVPSGMGPGEYNSAFYVHVYDWQLPFIINFEDGMPIAPDRAFRNIDYIHLVGGDDTDNMTVLGIDIDEVPL